MNLTFVIHILLMLLEMQSILSITSTEKMKDDSSTDNKKICRDRFGLWEDERFRHRACVLCYAYLFPNGKELIPLPPFYDHLVFKNRSFYSVKEVISADSMNTTSVDIVCQTLDENECRNWRLCCSAAASCCRQQRLSKKVAPQSCPPTWDGYECWDYGQAGQSVTSQCPEFLPYSIPARKAVKQCMSNGTWYTLGGVPWTDYRPCLDKDSYIQGTFLGVGCNIASIVLAIPAVLIFTCYRDLFRQDRIKIHLNFFISLTFCGIFTILWDMLVHYDKLTNPDTTATMMFSNSPWCKIISALKIYFTSTNYFWMFCEGYYLHQLITNAFEPPKTLLLLYTFGWGVPILHTSAYCIVRAVMADEHCWAYSFGNYEWIIYSPNLSCLVINLFFLCNILRILMFQLHSHPHEPSSFRRGLKAAFMLVPLFGLQLFLTIYRLPVTAPGQRAYEMITFFVINSQGAFVAIIFCFFNSEVLAHLRNTFHCFQRGRFRKCSHTATHYTTESPSRIRNGTNRTPSSKSLELNTFHDSRGTHLDNGKGRYTSQSKDGYLPVPVNHEREYSVTTC